MRALGFVVMVAGAIGIWMVPAGNPAMVGLFGLTILLGFTLGTTD